MTTNVHFSKGTISEQYLYEDLVIEAIGIYEVVVDNTNLKTYFKSKAAEREKFTDELKREIISFGEKPIDSGSITGDMHRTWMNIKSALSSNDEEAILEEVQRGEEASLEDYNEILEETSLPESTKAMITRQRNAIKNSVNNAKRYEHIVS